jgi:hypothetical protein
MPRTVSPAGNVVDPRGNLDDEHAPAGRDIARAYRTAKTII